MRTSCDTERGSARSAPGYLAGSRTDWWKAISADCSGGQHHTPSIWNDRLNPLNPASLGRPGPDARPVGRSVNSEADHLDLSRRGTDNIAPRRAHALLGPARTKAKPLGRRRPDLPQAPCRTQLSRPASTSGCLDPRNGSLALRPATVAAVRKASETPPEEWLAQNPSAFAVASGDGTPGAVVIPRREIPSWLDTSGGERDDIWMLVTVMRDRLADDLGPRIHVSFEEPAASGRLEIRLASQPQSIASATGRGTGLELVDSRNGRYLQLELVRCLATPEFDRIDLLVSFIMKSGLALIADRLDRALERGANARILTTDYLHVTDADALARLLDLSEAAEALAGALSIRVFSDPLTSFHPKAYLFHSTSSALACGFVGSNNLSHSGIAAGVEWSVGTQDVRPLVVAFDELWSDHRSQPLTHDFLRSYRSVWRPTAGSEIPVGVGIETEPPLEAPEPRPLQVEALAALSESRASGFEAGMVVMATGLGKTWLAAFDSASFGRTLFVAHREEILRQSRDVFRMVRPEAELGLYMGAEKQLDADVVFASVQTLVRNLDRFRPDDFDYIVIDEFHHAAASSYRRVIDYFSPRFLLGLTATPERMDGADLLALCGDNLVYDCGLIEGIDRGELVPFRYWGIKDVADYQGIPWRNGKFDPELLAQRIETQQRAQQAFDEWERRCGDRALGFCASVSHAEFMATFFGERGVRSVAVHSRPGSFDRREALGRLRSGDLQVVFAVDMFNEGIDVPEVDSVLMLRPTESPVIFLQQLGRGLRLSEAKDHLSVIDFVGNHRSFLLHPRVLLGLGNGDEPTTAAVLRAVESGEWDLPPGCSITFDVEAIDLLRLLAERTSSVGDALAQFCVDFSSEHETRPSAAQTAAAGYQPTAARKRHGGWFGLLDDLDLLEPSEAAVWNGHREALVGFEQENITKSYKLVTLRALLAAGRLRQGMSIAELATRSQSIVAADPRLIEDVTSASMPSPTTADQDEWRAFWQKWPLDHMTGESGLFRYEGDVFAPRFRVADEFGDAFEAMVAELVEWRLGDYLLRSATQDEGVIPCRLSHTGGSPIVRYDRTRHPRIPLGDTAFMANGQQYVGRFVKVALNTATLPGGEANELPNLLRVWFGHDAGHPGTRHNVHLRETDLGWELSPERPAPNEGLERFIGQRFNRRDVPALFGLEFNPGNWNSGHVSLAERNAVVLFVTLSKSSDMTHGSEYEDYFESPDVFVWSSQTSTGPESKKGREILGSESNGTVIHLFTREKKSDIAFQYRGEVTPISHSGDRPMSVRFQLV
jgi:superfamily II DNA or RNA helicase/HKD family nuclease